MRPLGNQMPRPMVMPQSAVQQQQQTFNLAQLHNLSPAEQVNLIGEELFAKISQIDAHRAGKITDEAIHVLDEAKYMPRSSRSMLAELGILIIFIVYLVFDRYHWYVT